MAYKMYLDGTLLPLTPAELTLKIRNQNSTMTLINEGEINLLKVPGLTEITFTALLPNSRYSLARYGGNFKKAQHYLDLFNDLKVNKKSFQFIVTRSSPGGSLLFDTNMTVSLEDYTISEKAKSLGTDISVDVSLKQFRPYAHKVITIIEEGEVAKAEAIEQRPADNAPSVTSYTVVPGDCLYNIARRFYGDGNRWREIYAANVDIVSDPNRIYPGQELSIP